MAASVGQHQIGRVAERRQQSLGCFIVHEILLQYGHARDGRAFEQVDPCYCRARVHLAGDLRPAARRNPQIDDRARFGQK
ncbi:MAG: hypothetical protein HC788_13175 [Sphingopyxis sp.]|nr:hypothetical protein [Sphingopyxis sp.]